MADPNTNSTPERPGLTAATSARTPPGVIWTAAGLATALAALSLIRHWNYLSGAYDLGWCIQNVWGVANGIWTNTVGGFHLFADHFSPVFVLLAPAAYLPTAETLLLIQAVAVASGVVPAYRLGTRYGGSRLGGLAVIWYGFSAAVWHAVAFDFHPVTLGVPMLMWLLFMVDSGEHRVGAVVLAFALAFVREDMAVLGAVIIFQGAFLRRRWREALWGILPATVGVGYIVWVSQWSGGMAGYNLWTRFSGRGSSSILESIMGAASNLVRPDPLISFSAVLLPVLVVPAFMGWKRSWPGLAIMLVNGVASYTQQASLYYQYFAPAVPFIIWGAAESWLRFRAGTAYRLSLVATAALFVVLGPVLYIGFGLPDRFASTIIAADERKAMSEIVSMVPEGVAVSATEMLLPHLAARQEIYPFPGPMVCPESLIFHVTETRFPRYVVVEWNDAVSGPDWRTVLTGWGYVEVASTQEAGLWRLEGESPPPIACPTMDDIRRNLDARHVHDAVS